MNEVNLKGIIRNIEFSHEVNNIPYYKANLIVPDNKGNDNIINLCFKKYLGASFENDLITLSGTLRSYSKKLSESKNQVSIYVFTYFDEIDNDDSILNTVKLDGRICKIDPIYITKSGKQCVHAILANNIFIPEQNIKLNNYIPIVFWGNLVNQVKELKINDKVQIEGQLHSRTYTKKNIDNSVEIKTAHEVVVKNYETSF